METSQILKPCFGGMFLLVEGSPAPVACGARKPSHRWLGRRAGRSLGRSDGQRAGKGQTATWGLLRCTLQKCRHGRPTWSCPSPEAGLGNAGPIRCSGKSFTYFKKHEEFLKLRIAQKLQIDNCSDLKHTAGKYFKKKPQMDRLAAHPFETLKLFLKETSRKNFKWVGQPDELMIEKRNFRNALYAQSFHRSG